MQLSIGTNYSLAVIDDYMIIKATQQQPHCYNNRQRSVKEFWICNQLNRMVSCSLLFKINRLAAFVGKRDCSTVIATF
jgi:hypothetical protein